MPGQRRRKARRRREADAWNRRLAGARWERRFSTQDRDELRTYLNLLTRSGVPADEVRIDMPCGRLEQPTWYTVSVLVPTPDRPS